MMKLKGLLGLALGLISATTFAQQARMIVHLKPGATPESVSVKYAIPLLDHTPGAPFALYAVPAGKPGDRLQRKMNTDRRLILWAEDDDTFEVLEHQSGKGGTIPALRLVSTASTRDDLYAANTNWLGQINWNSTVANTPGREVKVAVLDTGLAPNMTYLWNKTVASMNAVEPGLPAFDIPRGHDTNGDGFIDDATGHGTMVAGIVDQVSPQTKLVIARIADSDGVGTAWTILKGLAFAVTSGAEVANVSLGSIENVPALTDVMDWVEDQGLLVVAAIGNNGQELALNPADISKVVAVGGLLPDDTKAPFSNWEGDIDVSAPATGIVSQWWDGQTATWSGTSFATPMVTASIADALRFTAEREDPDDLRDTVEEHGDNLDAINRQYRGELGVKLNYLNLVNELRD